MLLVTPRHLSSMVVMEVGGWSPPFARVWWWVFADDGGRSWIVVAARGGWKVLVVAAGPIALMVVVVVVGRVTGFDVVGSLSS